jgi:hypothetical protein
VIRPALARAAEHQLDGVEASDAALGVGIAKRRIRGDEVVAGAGRLLVRLADVDRGGPARDQLDRGMLFARGQPRRTAEQGTYSQRSPAIAAAPRRLRGSLTSASLVLVTRAVGDAQRSAARVQQAIPERRS